MASKVCPPCAGSGMFPSGTRQVCRLCEGRGEIPIDPSRTILCKPCSGIGWTLVGLREAYCRVCDGYGWLHVHRVEKNANDLVVFYVEAGKPRSAHLTLRPVLEALAGPVEICDPYYGEGTLARLDLLSQCTPIRFLTQKRQPNEPSQPRLFSEWVRQHGDIEFKKVSGGDIHDRFVLTSSELILLGQGLKDPGNKESFIVRISASVGEDLMRDVRESFERRWQAATPIHLSP